MKIRKTRLNTGTKALPSHRKHKAANSTPPPLERVELSPSSTTSTKPNPVKAEASAPENQAVTKPVLAQSFSQAPMLAAVPEDREESIHQENIDGFLAKLLQEKTMPTVAKKDMLVTADTVFPSLEHGTRHRVSRVERPDDYPERGDVPDEWGKNYRPSHHTSAVVAKGPVWAEAVDFLEAAKKRAEKEGMDGSNLTDQDLTRLFPSYESPQVIDGQLRNPRGPTGITGQGLLGKHGENTAADPIVFRRHKNPETGESKLQMIAILRQDNGKWAIPGGMTDYGETVSATLGRELREEALGDKLTEEQAQKFDTSFKQLFEERGTLVYQGTVDDFRNTDTSWMATKVQMMEIDQSDAAHLGWDMKLEGGDDAKEALWMTVSAENLATLNANHGDFVGKAVQTWQNQTGLALRKDGVLGKPGEAAS